MKISISCSRTILPGLAGLAGVLVLLVLSLANEYQNANQHAQVEVENISRLLEGQALSTVQKSDLLLRDVLGNVRPGDMRMARDSNSERARALHALMKSHLETVPELSALHLTNAKGEHIHSSRDELPHIDISDRYHFVRQRDDPNAGLVFSSPVVSRTTGKWTLILTRRIDFEDGSFAGIINGILDPEYFQKFYRSLDMGKHGVVSLYDKELRLVARYPQRDEDLGKTANLYAKTYIDKGIKHATYRARSTMDGIDRMYSFQQVGELPLFVFTGLASDDYLAEWRLHAWEYGTGFVILCFVVAGFSRRQRRAEQALRKKSQLFDGVIENIPNMIFLKRASDLRFELFNRAGETLLGQNRNELLGRNDYDLFPKEQADSSTRKDRAVLKQNGIVEIAEELIETPGGTRTLHTKKLTLRDEQGQPQYLLGISEDITERKRMETDLMENEEKFRSMSACTQDALIMMDDEGNINFWNTAAEKVFGYSSAEVMGKELHTFIAPEKYYEAFKKVYGHFRETGEGAMIGKTRELMALRKGGDEFPVELSLASLKLKDKWHGVGIVRDITKRKVLEQQSIQYSQHAKALINAASESNFLLDSNGVVLAINDTALARLRLTEEEVLGNNIFNFLPTEIAAKRRAVLLDVLKSRIPIKTEDERAGIKFLATYTPILDEAGKVVQVAVYAADVTERRQLEAIEQLLPTANHKILEGAPFQEVLDMICEKTVEAFDLALVWAGRKMEDGSISLIAASGPAQGYLSALKEIGVRWDDTPLGRGPTGYAIRTGEMQHQPVDDLSFSSWAEAAVEHGIGSSIAVPLVLRGNIYGVFALYSKQATQFESPSVRKRIAVLADKIRLAIEISSEQEQITLLSTALSSASNAVMITDPRGRIEWVNPAFVLLSGYSSAELIGFTPSILNSGKHDAEYYKALWQTILGGKVWNADTTEKRKDGTLYTVQQTITPIRSDSGEITHFVAIHEDVSAKLETQARIQHIASHDGLTGLPNRSLFFDRLSQLFTLSKRNQTSLALMFIDLDGFKQVNDKLGHHIGDLLLKGVAERLLACVRDSDTVARLGGDEFTVTLFDISGRENIVNIAEKILDELSRPFDLEGHNVAIGASIGIATATPERQISEDKLIERADSAMYEAKRAGKRCYRFAFEE